MFKHGAQMLILVLLAGLVLMRESRQPPLDTGDNWWADFLAMNSRHGVAPAPVTLVEINASSLQNHAWPWSPIDYSLFFQAALPHQPAVLAIDEVLDWSRIVLSNDQVQKLPQYEQILRGNLLRAPKTLLGAQLGFPDDPQLAPPWQEVPLLRNVKGDLSAITEFPLVEREPSEDYRLTASIGFTNLPTVHERFNSVPLLFRHQGQIIPAFPLQAVMLWAKLTPDDVKVELGSFIQVGPKLRIPIDASGRMRVDFGCPRDSFGFDEMLLAADQIEAKSKPAIDLSQMKGKIVLLSRTDAEAQTIPLAAGRNGSPGELFAAAIATIQTQSFIRRSPLWAELLIIGIVALISFRVPRLKKGATLFLGLVMLAIYVLLSLAVFNRWLIWLPGVAPFGMVLFFVIFRICTPDSTPRARRPVIL